MQRIAIFFDWLRHRAHLRRWEPKLALGRRGEDLAHRFLRRQGYTIVARNYRLGSGDAEADIIAWDGDALAFVEVKTRSSQEFGPPERAIDASKRAHLLRVAREYTRKSATPWEKVRFDLVTVIQGRRAELRLIRGAWRQEP